MLRLPPASVRQPRGICHLTCCARGGRQNPRFLYAPPAEIFSKSSCAPLRTACCCCLLRYSAATCWPCLPAACCLLALATRPRHATWRIDIVSQPPGGRPNATRRGRNKLATTPPLAACCGHVAHLAPSHQRLLGDDKPRGSLSCCGWCRQLQEAPWLTPLPARLVRRFSSTLCAGHVAHSARLAGDVAHPPRPHGSFESARLLTQ